MLTITYVCFFGSGRYGTGKVDPDQNILHSCVFISIKSIIKKKFENFYFNNSSRVREPELVPALFGLVGAGAVKMLWLWLWTKLYKWLF